jgi:transcriptional regulator with XRE-family HTH domain
MLKNIKLLRDEFGISQQKLADEIGMSQQSVNGYENHSNEPDISTLIKMADYFNTSVDYIVAYTDIRHKIEPVEEMQLNADERKMMLRYRSLLPNQRESLRVFLDTLSWRTE